MRGAAGAGAEESLGNPLCVCAPPPSAVTFYPGAEAGLRRARQVGRVARLSALHSSAGLPRGREAAVLSAGIPSFPARAPAVGKGAHATPEWGRPVPCRLFLSPMSKPSGIRFLPLVSDGLAAWGFPGSKLAAWSRGPREASGASLRKTLGRVRLGSPVLRRWIPIGFTQNPKQSRAEPESQDGRDAHSSQRRRLRQV